jgi:DNA-binding transcriptional ArsR family regulator
MLTGMNDANDKRLDLIFHALSDTTRRRLLLAIAEKDCMVTELAAPFAMSLNAVSKHLKVLEQAGLLARTKDGRVHRCRLDPRPLAEARQMIDFYQRFWTEHLDDVAAALAALDGATDDDP